MSLQRVIGAALLTLSFLAGCGGSGSGGGGAGGASGDGSGGGSSLGEAVTSGSPDTSTALASLSSTGDGGTTEEAGTSGSSDASAASTALSSNVTAGTAIGVSLPPGAAQGEVTAEIDQAPVEVVVDGDEAVVVVPDDVPPGTHTPDLQDHLLVAFDEKLAQHRVAQWLGRVAPAARVVARNNSVLGMLYAARSGIGVAPLPTALGDEDPGLVRLFGPVPELSRIWRVLAHRDRRHAPGVAALFDFIVEEQDRLRPVLTG